jgi:hypothetical protein
MEQNNYFLQYMFVNNRNTRAAAKCNIRQQQVAHKRNRQQQECQEQLTTAQTLNSNSSE